MIKYLLALALDTLALCATMTLVVALTAVLITLMRSFLLLTEKL